MPKDDLRATLTAMCSVDGCAKEKWGRGMCSMHYTRLRIHGTTDNPRPSAAERFWSRVDQSGSCWLWTGFIKPEGYGLFSDEGRRTAYAHRWAYEDAKGSIPEGLQIDHLCRNRACVNPDHLEAVTPAVNTYRSNGTSAINYRKTHCQHGHEFTEENTIVTSQGRRRCITCQREYDRVRYEARKAAL